MGKGRVDRHLASGLPYDLTTTVTTDEGLVCVFIAVDHCTAECDRTDCPPNGALFHR